jgi:hypothetical protein
MHGEKRRVLGLSNSNSSSSSNSSSTSSSSSSSSSISISSSSSPRAPLEPSLEPESKRCGRSPCVCVCVSAGETQWFREPGALQLAKQTTADHSKSLQLLLGPFIVFCFPNQKQKTTTVPQRSGCDLRWIAVSWLVVKQPVLTTPIGIG